MSAIGTGGGPGLSVAAEGEAEDVDLDGDDDDGDVDGGGGVELGPALPGMVFGEVAGDEGRAGRCLWSQGRTGVGADVDGAAGAAFGPDDVMNVTISSLRRCQAVIVSKYPTNGFPFASCCSLL